MTQYLALILLGPSFLIMVWAYWCYPESLPRTQARRWFDGLIILSAVVIAVVLTHYSFVTAGDVPHPGRVGIWQLLAPVLCALTGFCAALALGAVVRQKVWRAHGKTQA